MDTALFTPRGPGLDGACLSEACNIPVQAYESTGKKRHPKRKATPTSQADFIPVPRFPFIQTSLRAN